MKYHRFEDLLVWKQAIQLAHGVYALTRNRYFAQSGDLQSQLRRAALSVSNNIAEGFERGTTSELITFLYIARGSAGEVRSMLRFVEATHEAADLKSQISNLISLAEQCSRQLRAWADHLQHSGIKGQRHLNNESREAFEQERNAQRFEQYLQEIVEQGLQQRERGRQKLWPDYQSVIKVQITRFIARKAECLDGFGTAGDTYAAGCQAMAAVRCPPSKRRENAIAAISVCVPWHRLSDSISKPGNAESRKRGKCPVSPWRSRMWMRCASPFSGLTAECVDVQSHQMPPKLAKAGLNIAGGIYH